MTETTHASDIVNGTHSGDVAGTPTNDSSGHPETAHGDHADGAALGPIDWHAWGAGLLGIAAGLAVAACLFVSTNS